MARQQPEVVKSLQQLLDHGPATGLNDRQLLERFVARHDEAAFAALLASHGPMVLGVCRRILRDGHDIEDAFQATFLVLVQRAGSIRDAGRLGPWLHGVARRVALRARREAARRQARHRPVKRVVGDLAVHAGHTTELDELRAIIDEEIARLPARYRDAVVLCDLEGRSYAEATVRLRCPLGTVQSRLARGRARLRSRLIRRGLAPVALEPFLIDEASAAVPHLLAETTVHAAIALVAGNGVVSATAAELARSVTTSMRMSVAMARAIGLALVLASMAIGVDLAGYDARSHALPPLATSSAAQPKPVAEPEGGRTVQIEVSSKEDGSPLPGATVWARAVGGRIRTWEGTTDEEGRYTIVLAAGETTFLNVVAAVAGRAGWSGGGPRANYSFPLERVETIGGTVLDEQGQPIEGASVFPALRNGAPVWPEIFTSSQSALVVATTNARGRWRIDALPVDTLPGAPLKVMAMHPDHIPTAIQSTAEKGRAFAIEQVMKKGVSVAGTVQSPFGRPIPDASVVVTMPSWETVPTWERMYLRLTTDKDGRFSTGRCFDPIRRDPALTVQATGLATAAQVIPVKPGALPRVIRLVRRRPIEGRVVDTRGRPVAGAAVSPSQSMFRGVLDWDAETDANGRFVWYDAPTTGTILLDVSKPTFRSLTQRAVDPEAGEIAITLYHPQRLHGTVTDAETGKPIEQFTLLQATERSLSGVRPNWERDPHGIKTFANGQFDLSRDFFDARASRQSVLIEADGYQPAAFVGFRDHEEDVAHDFKLQKAMPLTGIVRGTDGKPLAGAELGVNDIASDVRARSRRFMYLFHERSSIWTKTDGNGRYSIPSRGRGALVMVVHKAGFAVRSPEQLAASSEITVQPWGRIEGVVKIGRESASNVSVWAWPTDRRLEGLVEHTTRTDREGRFALDQVAPGLLTVFRPVARNDGHGHARSNAVNVQVAPGQTVRIQIGGTGRPVIGRLALPPGARVSDFVSGHARLRSQPPALQMPAGFINFTDKEWSAWWDRFNRSPIGWSFLERDRQFDVAIRPDATFRIDDVPSGRYVLELPFREPAAGDSSRRLAFACALVEVAEIPGGRSDEPLDIGSIPLAVFPFRKQNAGGRVPDRISNPADGRTLDLAALRGKVVLLAFWSTRWSMANLPYLKATHDAFGRDPRFVMIGLNQDFAPEAMKWAMARHDLTWDQWYLGTGDDPNPIAAAFGVQFEPVVFLIGPDGRVIARDLEGDGIKQCVGSA